MNLRVWIFLAIFFTYNTQCLSQNQNTDLVHLLNSVERHHPQLKSLRAELQGTRENLNDVKAAYRPSIFLEGNIRTSTREATLQGGGEFSQTLSPREASVRLTQTLYNGGRRKYQQHGAFLNIEAAKARYDTVSDGIKAEVMQDYISLSATLKRIEILEDTVSVLNELEKATSVRKDFGDSSKIEIAQIQSRRANAGAQLASAKAQRNILTARIEAATGIFLLEASLPDPGDDVFERDIEEIKQNVRRHSPALKASTLEERSARILIISQSRSRLPTISLTAAAVASDNNSPTIDQDNQLSVGVRLTMPLYSGGSISSQRRRAAASLQSAKYNYHNDLRETDIRVVQLWENIISGQSILASQKANLAASAEALKGVIAAEKSGLTTASDILDAVEDRLEAEIAYSDARHNNLNNIFLLLFQMGELESQLALSQEPEINSKTTEEK